MLHHPVSEDLFPNIPFEHTTVAVKYICDVTFNHLEITDVEYGDSYELGQVTGAQDAQIVCLWH